MCVCSPGFEVMVVSVTGSVEKAGGCCAIGGAGWQQAMLVSMLGRLGAGGHCGGCWGGG
jgi:hypothetical protein